MGNKVLKQPMSNHLTRVFNKETSVFAAWRQDTRQSIAASFKIDWNNTRVSKLIKSQDDMNDVHDFMESNYEFITEIYRELQMNSLYPFVNKIELAAFCEKSKLIDANLNMANCDLIFVMANTATKGGIKAKTGLIRCEFLEYLIRLANFKHRDTKQVDTFIDAIQIVINDYIKPNVEPLPWQSFRDEELWTIEVNDVFDCNLDGISKIQSYYSTPT